MISLAVLCLVLFAGDAQASMSAWAWANQPTTPSYAPSARYAYNPTGGSISIDRLSKGMYSVRFSDLVPTAGIGGNVQVTASGWGSTTCRLIRWTFTEEDLVVSAACFTHDGTPADSAFTVLYTFN